MSLVSYDYSDSDEDEYSNTEVIENESHKANTTSFNELFSSLPKPKKNVITPEDDLVVLQQKSYAEIGSSKVPPTKGPVKISIPALKNYESDEDEPAKKIPKPSVKATGLFAILPAPKCSSPSKQSMFDPKVIKSKNLVPRAVKAQAAKAKKPVESDDSDTEGEHFFSSIFTDKKAPEKKITSVLNMPIDSAAPVKDMSSKSNQYFADLITSQKATVEAEVVESVEDTEEITNEKAIRQLCGKSRQNKDQEIQFIDINADQIMPDSREWRTKALTEEKPATASGKKGEEPSHQSRRKHQITYLAYQAKMNEQELQNQWASNRISRKQTQAKYGF